MEDQASPPAPPAPSTDTSASKPLGELAEEMKLEKWQLNAVLARKDLFLQPGQSFVDAPPLTITTKVSPAQFKAAVDETLHGPPDAKRHGGVL